MERELGREGLRRLLPIAAGLTTLMTACIPSPASGPIPERMQPVSTLVEAQFGDVGMHPGLGPQLDS
ncbi:MAG TPA: hypothetical protein VGR27_04440, partial [Longimicrobiaceae bacterium]|nr:hypothetical protein [Longimicrobiaceae bacterium]